MDKIFNKPIKTINTIIGIIILALGFLNLSYDWIPILAPFSLAITGLAAFAVTFGLESIKMLFSKPQKTIKTFFTFFLLAVVVSMLTSFFLMYVLKLDLTGNPAVGNVPWLSLPFMLLGEELISFFVFAIIASLFKNNNKQLLIASFGSAIVFALLHVPTYWDGNIIITLLHVLALQGVSRLVFNSAGVKSNSIIVPWVIHVIFDSLMFSVSLLLLVQLF
ncbi:CPBP family glutamic-type intramembrane protease [Clostridium sp. LP20]|uniref:CPBP family glutamic-type intramembrane protease n=1 Tax=Clostridium sp. LP20 TaxID=3418665 RepID=UPI003EE5D74A